MLKDESMLTDETQTISNQKNDTSQKSDEFLSAHDVEKISLTWMHFIKINVDIENNKKSCRFLFHW